MKKSKRWMSMAITGAAIWALSVFAPTAAHAQTPSILSYGAKFVCGTNAPGNFVYGIYATTVNIHNPHFVPVVFKKKAVIALSQRSEPGEISPLVEEALGPDAALGVDCTDIRNLFPTKPKGFIEGFLVIQVYPASDQGDLFELDVVAAYTARHRTGTDSDTKKYDIESMDVEEVSPKTVALPLVP
jgi:hypothetical protein